MAILAVGLLSCSPVRTDNTGPRASPAKSDDNPTSVSAQPSGRPSLVIDGKDSLDGMAFVETAAKCFDEFGSKVVVFAGEVSGTPYPLSIRYAYSHGTATVGIMLPDGGQYDAGNDATKVQAPTDTKYYFTGQIIDSQKQLHQLDLEIECANYGRDAP